MTIGEGNLKVIQLNTTQRKLIRKLYVRICYRLSRTTVNDSSCESSSYSSAQRKQGRQNPSFPAKALAREQTSYAKEGKSLGGKLVKKFINDIDYHELIFITIYHLPEAERICLTESTAIELTSTSCERKTGK